MGTPGFVTTLGGYDLTQCARRIRQWAPLEIVGLSKGPLLHLQYRKVSKDPGVELFHGVRAINSPGGLPRQASYLEYMPEDFPPSLKLIMLRKEFPGEAILVQSLDKRAETERVKYVARFDIMNELRQDNKTMDDFPVEQLDWTRGEIVHARSIVEFPYSITHVYYRRHLRFSPRTRKPAKPSRQRGVFDYSISPRTQTLSRNLSRSVAFLVLVSIGQAALPQLIHPTALAFEPLTTSASILSTLKHPPHRSASTLPPRRPPPYKKKSPG